MAADHRAPEVRVLGPVQVVGPAGPVPLVGVKPRVLLAALALNVGELMVADRLVEALWPAGPPRSARENLRTYVAAVRHALETAGPARLVTRRTGYLLELDRWSVDQFAFTELSARGRQQRVAGDASAAVVTLTEALGRWTGPAGEDLPRDGWVGSVLAGLDDRRLAAVEERADARLALGRHEELLVELERVVAEHPLRERAWRQLLVARYGSGDVAGALAAFRAARRALVDNLGVEPGTELAAAHDAVLRREHRTGPGPAIRHRPAPAAGGPDAGPADPGPQAAGGGVLVRHELPGPPAVFVGRQRELAAVRAELLTALHGHGPVVVALDGPAGVGKSAMALRAAHGARAAFPDGQLYVELDAGAPPDPLQVLQRLLRSLGAAAPPSDPREAAGLLRTLLADRRVLLLLDGAPAGFRIGPLLPPGVGSAAIVTSRTPVGLAEATHRRTLGPLSLDAGVELLARMIGRDRVAAEPAAVTDVVACCGRSPHALRAAALLLAGCPGGAVADLRDRLGRTAEHILPCTSSVPRL